METLKIIILCVASAIVYGILHDQVTARVCVEYFTIGHPDIFGTQSPTLLAFGWGVVATWWVGLLLGIPAALVSRIGSWPKYTAARLVRPICVLAICMGFASVAAGLYGYFANPHELGVPQSLWSEPESKRAAFRADLFAHLTAYAVGTLGGVAVWGWILVSRWRMSVSKRASSMG